MDSATLAYFLKNEDIEQHFISFNYGQRHARELRSAREIAKQLSSKHHVIDISTITPLLLGSSQTDLGVQVPEGHYEQENMKLTVVPNRNAIMLSIAYAAAVAEQAQLVSFGAHSGDHFIYPDCRPVFIKLLSETLYKGNEGFCDPGLTVAAPFADWDKTTILRWGLNAGVPYKLTWTCYNGREKACGKCGSCVERLQSFANCGEKDPLEYEDREFWKQAVQKHNTVNQ